LDRQLCPGSNPGPWHGHRLAHCAPGDLPPHLQGKSLGYEIVEVAKCSALQMLKVRDGADDGASRRNGPRTYVAAISRSSAISETLKNFFSAVS